MSQEKSTITFHGGVGEVTGANFLLDDKVSGLKILVDCGLFQSVKSFDEKNRDPFPYDPASIDYLFVTHAHLDHIGRIPKLIRDGFKGVIYSTPPTKEISEWSLRDGLNLFKREERGEAAYFDLNDIKKAMELWQTVGYHQELKLKDDLSVYPKDAGHILGSTMYEFRRGGKKFIFTGDLGNSPSPLLPDTEKIEDANYILMESVYGDRNHEDRSERRNILEDAIEDTFQAGGTLMIPAFSIERTQEILYEIESMMEESRIPLIPVFLDSPLGIEITGIYKKYSNYLNEKVREQIKKSDKVFHFPQLHETLKTEESKAIFQANPKKIVIAGSGMSTGGRILHHEQHYLPDPKSTLLLVGYQEIGSLGRLIQEGARSVRIMGQDIPINAKIVTIHGYSAHKDSDHLLQFVNDTRDTIKRVFVAMGETRASMFLAQRIRDYLGIDARCPAAGETLEIDL